jgi:transposase-like protein
MKDAWQSKDPLLAKSQLERLAHSLAKNHPGAAASLREGFDETLTLITLGVDDALYRTLRTTNPIENLNGSIAHYTRNVKRWRDGRMLLRWVASSLHEAPPRLPRSARLPRHEAIHRGARANCARRFWRPSQRRVTCSVRSRRSLTVQHASGHRRS